MFYFLVLFEKNILLSGVLLRFRQLEYGKILSKTIFLNIF